MRSKRKWRLFEQSTISSWANAMTRIISQFSHDSVLYDVTYNDGVPNHEDGIAPDGVHAFCFYNKKIVLVYNAERNSWTPPGGAIERGESVEEASIREIKEEANMKVLHQEYIGYQDIVIPQNGRIERQYRMFCIVEPFGDFHSDPDGDITEVACVDPQQFNEYVHWGEIGEHILKRAVEIHENI